MKLILERLNISTYSTFYTNDMLYFAQINFVWSAKPDSVPSSMYMCYIMVYVYRYKDHHWSAPAVHNKLILAKYTSKT